MKTDPFAHKGLPSNIEAERAILGAILLDNRICDQAVQLLNRETFFLESHRRIYDRLVSLNEQNVPIDLITLKDELERSDDFEYIGGATYLASLIDGVPRTDTIDHYAKIVKETWYKRRLLSLSSKISATVWDDELPFDQMLSEAEEGIFELTVGKERGHGPEHVADVAAKLADFYEAKIDDPHRLIGLSTGYEDLDEATQGLSEGVHLLAGRTSMGKTAAALNIGWNAAKQGGSVFIASLESSTEKLVQRLLAMIARVDSLKMRQGRMDRDEWVRLSGALSQLLITRFVIDDTADLQIPELRSRCRQYKSKHGLDLLIIDYIQLMGKRLAMVKKLDDRIGIARVSADLIKLSRELHIPILALAQISRAVEQRADHRPTLSDLSDCGQLEMDADTVMMIYRPEVYTKREEDKGIATIIFGKQRDGSTEHDVHLAFIKEYVKFEDLDRSYWPESKKRARYTGARYERKEEE